MNSCLLPKRCTLPMDSGDRCRKRTRVRYYYDEKASACQSFKYSGCGGNENRFQTNAECQSTCQDVCQLPKDPGPCRSAMPRFYYDSQAGACLDFSYGGCDGNGNNFLTKNDCDSACVVNSSKLPAGCVEDPLKTCFAAFTRFVFNVDKGVCEKKYAVCHGFITERECKDKCE